MGIDLETVLAREPWTVDGWPLTAGEVKRIYDSITADTAFGLLNSAGALAKLLDEQSDSGPGTIRRKVPGWVTLRKTDRTLQLLKRAGLIRFDKSSKGWVRVPA